MGGQLRRENVGIDANRLSVLTAGADDFDPLVLLHGTFWSRVWQPVLPELGTQLRCFAVDLPGFGHSDGELTVEQATIPELARIVLEAADGLGLESFHVAGHDIGGGIAQYLAGHEPKRVRRMVLMNSVMFDSWPVPGVERFKDPQVRAHTTAEQLLSERRISMDKAVARALTPEEVDDYLGPLRDERRVRSWMAMAAAADSVFTVDLVPLLSEQAVPTRLVWGRDDEFQRIEYARCYVEEIPDSDLVEIPGRHIPTEDNAALVAAAMLDHLTERST